MHAAAPCSVLVEVVHDSSSTSPSGTPSGSCSQQTQRVLHITYIAPHCDETLRLAKLEMFDVSCGDEVARENWPPIEEWRSPHTHLGTFPFNTPTPCPNILDTASSRGLW